jgi:molybdopterin/thiamine biosynthesis adenylyltransferase
LSVEIIRATIQAVATDGFKSRLIGDGLELHGAIKVGPTTVPMQIRFEDLTLATSPRCYLPDVSMLPRKVVPHLDSVGEFCVVDRNQFVFDRYRAPEQTRGLIERAKEVLERGMTKGGTEEIANEFTSYWVNYPLKLPATAEGNKGLNIATVTTDRTLSFEAHQSKPETLGELIEWANYWDKKLGPQILAGLGRCTYRDPLIEIHAANATVIARLMVTPGREKIAQTLTRQLIWQRHLKSAAALALPIKRADGRRTDLEKIFGMNGPEGAPPLAGKKIVLVGCGAIGGYLSRMLVQTGAGLSARLTLIDPDYLNRENIRRHALGLADLDRPKAEACAEMIGRDFPGIDVVPQVEPAQRHEAILASADLVIDATGEQEFSEWLNEWALARRKGSAPCPALLFSWIAGQGIATQSFMIVDDVYACLRCLQPDHNKLGRFDPRQEQDAEPVVPCGEQPFTRYGPAASTAAASLASSHAVDWALGRPHHLLRTIRIDWEGTVKRDPKSPDKAGDCPACGSK